MANVYDKLNDFYLNNKDAKFFFDKRIMERHLRKCAWNEESEETLNLRFELFSLTILSAIDIDLDSVYDLVPEDYLEIFYELADIENKKLNENLVKKYLKYLEELFLEREPKGFKGKLEEIEFIRMFFYDEGKFRLLKREEKNSYKDRKRRKKTSDKETAQMNFLREKWLNKIRRYFDDTVFEMDIKRAKILLFNDISNIPEDFDEMFKDYFLFDYHLIKTDETPIEFFLRSEKENLDDISIEIIEEYLRVKFTLFYVKQEIDDVFLCRDFFREREFYLPISSENFPEYKNMIFYAHIDDETLANANYIGTFYADEDEQKRIVEEINSAYKLYAYQVVNVSYAKFFSRHVSTVHQIIDSVMYLSKHNIIPKDLYVEMIKTNFNILEDYEEPIKRLMNMGENVVLSKYALKLLEKYYHDFLVKSKLTRGQNESEITLAAVLNNFLTINYGGRYQISEKILPSNIDIDKLNLTMDEINQILDVEYFDPRYLTEEGFSCLITQGHL